MPGPKTNEEFEEYKKRETEKTERINTKAAQRKEIDKIKGERAGFFERHPLLDKIKTFFADTLGGIKDAIVKTFVRVLAGKEGYNDWKENRDKKIMEEINRKNPSFYTEKEMLNEKNPYSYGKTVVCYDKGSYIEGRINDMNTVDGKQYFEVALCNGENVNVTLNDLMTRKTFDAKNKALNKDSRRTIIDEKNIQEKMKELRKAEKEAKKSEPFAEEPVELNEVVKNDIDIQPEVDVLIDNSSDTSEKKHFAKKIDNADIEDYVFIKNEQGKFEEGQILNVNIETQEYSLKLKDNNVKTVNAADLFSKTDVDEELAKAELAKKEAAKQPEKAEVVTFSKAEIKNKEPVQQVASAKADLGQSQEDVAAGQFISQILADEKPPEPITIASSRDELKKGEHVLIPQGKKNYYEGQIIGFGKGDIVKVGIINNGGKQSLSVNSILGKEEVLNEGLNLEKISQSERSKISPEFIENFESYQQEMNEDIFGELSDISEEVDINEESVKEDLNTLIEDNSIGNDSKMDYIEIEADEVSL